MIIRILVEDHAFALHPVFFFKRERAGSDRMKVELRTVHLDGFAWHHGQLEHREGVEESINRFLKRDFKFVVVDDLHAFDRSIVIELLRGILLFTVFVKARDRVFHEPPALGIVVVIGHPLPRIDHVLRFHFSTLAVGETGVIMEKDAGFQFEVVGEAILRDGWHFRQ